MPPTITSITPASGLSAGRTYVIIDGTGFDTSGEVQVSFGGVQATDVMIRSATRLSCRNPIPAIDPGSLGMPVAVDVIVDNVDEPASVTEVNGYSYVRPDLTDDQTLLQWVEELMVQIRIQVLDNVSLRAGTDYNRSGSTSPPPNPNTKRQGTIKFRPLIILQGPNMTPNKEDDTQELTVIRDETAETYEKFLEPLTENAEFDLILRTGNEFHHLNLIHRIKLFFHQNPFITVLRDPDDPSKGTVEFELEVLSPFSTPKPSGEESRANVAESIMTFHIRGVPVEVIEVLEQGTILGDPPDVQINVEKKT